MAFVILAVAAAVLALLLLFASYICAQLVFAVHSTGRDEPGLPAGKQYLEVKDDIFKLVAQASALPYEDVYTSSFDGLRLHAKLYYKDSKAQTHILFHGYRSSALLDFSGALRDGVEQGYNVLLVDQRAHAASEGKYLSFGINESRDCLCWVNFVRQNIGEESPILLKGLSMGAATVLMASALELPDSVRAIVADSGYSSPETIIRHVMKQQHYPQLLFPLIRLGGRIFCGFDISAHSPVKAVEKCSLPVLFIHGRDDRFVPCEMGMENYRACKGRKAFFTVPDAGHGLCYLKDEAGYKRAYDDFFREIFP